MLPAYHSLAGRTKFYDRTKIPASICRTPRACIARSVGIHSYLGVVPWLTPIYRG